MTMTTEPGRPVAASTSTSVVVAKILASGASAGSMLVLMAAMAVGQQQEAVPTSPVELDAAVRPASTAGQVPTPRAASKKSGGPSRPRPVAGETGDSASSRTAPIKASKPVWRPAPKSVPKSAPRSEPAPRVTPVKPAPAPPPVVQPAPSSRVPDATSRAS